MITVNHKPFKQYKGSRQLWFESLDQPAFKPLPKNPYEYTAIKTVKVNIDYHIQYDEHLYSVPHHLVGEKLSLHARSFLIELFFNNQCVASHPRAFVPGMTTRPEHMPTRHQKHQQWSRGRLMNWAQDIGPEVLRWVQALLQRKAHEQQAYRACLGLLNLSRQYPAVRLNNACVIANGKHLYRLKQVKEILISNQDQLVDTVPEQTTLLPQSHENIRGPGSFH
ncbi:MAG: hypothetical protein ACI8P9_004218 [Parasphingorhabdus sp.]